MFWIKSRRLVVVFDAYYVALLDGLVKVRMARIDKEDLNDERESV